MIILLHQDEIIHLIERQMGKGAMGVKEKEISKREMEWRSFANDIKTPSGKKEELRLDEFPDMDEEIIELLDVVEEREAKMSIEDLISEIKEEPLKEMTHLESWKQLEEGVKPTEKGFDLFQEKKELGELFPHLKKEATLPTAILKEEPFEKIELDEILKKMGQLEPAPELSTFEEFEAALQKGGEIQPLGKEIPPFFTETPKVEAPMKEAPPKESLKELRELSEEEFSEDFFEELGGKQIHVIEEPMETRAKAIEPEGLGPLKPIIDERGFSPQVKEVEEQVEEIIFKRVREMMDEFTKKLVPEVTQSITALTLDRIDKIVKETVPDLAEKAIKEEIKRLQKGEKE